MQVETAEALAEFVEARGLALPVVAFGGDYDALSERLELPGGPPCTILFGKSGEIGRIEGVAGEGELEALLAQGRAR
jgi:hypothetical protein